MDNLGANYNCKKDCCFVASDTKESTIDSRNYLAGHQLAYIPIIISFRRKNLKTPKNK
jgi:hypothetical protein